MQVIEESIDVKSMKPSLLTRQLVRMIALAHEDTEIMRSIWRRRYVLLA